MRVSYQPSSLPNPLPTLCLSLSVSPPFSNTLVTQAAYSITLSFLFFAANPLPGLIESGGNLSTMALAQIVGDTSLHPYHPAVHISRSLLSEPLLTVFLCLLFSPLTGVRMRPESANCGELWEGLKENWHSYECTSFCISICWHCQTYRGETHYCSWMRCDSHNWMKLSQDVLSKYGNILVNDIKENHFHCLINSNWENSKCAWTQ